MELSKRGQMGIGAIVGVLVLIVVAVALLPTINTSIAGYNGTGSDLLDNVPLFVVIGILLAAIAGAGIAYMRR
jgi:hypothetical protein